MPEAMKSIKINHGELNTAIRPLPTPLAGEVLIKVAAAGVKHSNILAIHLPTIAPLLWRD